MLPLTNKWPTIHVSIVVLVDPSELVHLNNYVDLAVSFLLESIKKIFL
jgi:hypothetical protein